MELLQALNAASALLQRSARSEEALFRTFSEQIGSLDLIGVISLLDESQNRFVIRSIGLPLAVSAILQGEIYPDIRNLLLPLETAELHNQVLTSGCSLFIENGTQAFLDHCPVDYRGVVGLALQSIAPAPGLMSPILFEGKTKGVISLLGKSLSASDLPAVEAFANHISVALDNARLILSMADLEAQYRRLFECANDAILLIDPETRLILAVNPKTVEITGYPEMELEGMPLAHLYAVHSGGEVDHLFNQLRHQKTAVLILTLQRRDGEQRKVECSATVFEVGGANLIQSILHDITESQMALDALRVSEQTLRVMVEQSHQMEDALRRRAEELAAVHKLSLDITAALELPELLQAVVERATQLLNAYGGILYLNEPEEKLTRCVVSYRTFSDYTGKTLKFGEGAGGIVAETGEPLIISDYRKFEQRINVDLDVRPQNAVLTVPMIGNGQVVGVLQVVDNSDMRCFTNHDQELLTLFADQAAIAIENARLLEAERAARVQAETLREVARVLAGSLELKEVLRLLQEQLARVLRFDTTSVLILDDVGLPQLISGFGYENEEETCKQATRLLADSPMLVQMAKDLKPLLIDDARTYPEWIWVPGATHVRSFLAVPIIFRQRMIGALMADSAQINFFTENDINTARSLAQHMAVAVENARLFEAERFQLAVAQTLQEVGALLTSQLSLEDVLESLLDLLLRVVHYDSVSIQLINSTGRLELSAGRGFPHMDRFRKLIQDISDELLSREWYTGKVMVISDTYSDPRWFKAPHSEYIRSWIGAPLMVKGRLIGILNVDSKTPSAFDNSIGETIMAFANQAAIAIENARLFKQAQVERRHLSLLYDVGRELATSLDPNLIIERAISLTCEALGGTLGEGYLYLPQEHSLSWRAIYGVDPDPNLLLNFQADLELEGGLSGYVARSRQAVYVPDLSKDPHWLPIPGLDEDALSAISAPVLDETRLLGVISILHHNRDAFNLDQLNLLQAICQQVSLALNNADRYQQVQNLVDLLAAEQDRLESLIGRLPLGVLMLDNNYRLLISNPLGTEILDTLETGHLGEPLERLGSFPLSELIAHHLDPSPVEISWEGPPRRIYEVQARSIGGDTQWLVTIREVTRERENQLRVQMQERLATVGQLAAGIAHDFNNIMAAILVYTDLLTMDSSLSHGSRERLHVIRQQVQRAASLIRQILDFSRRSLMEQSSIDLLPFLKELEKLLSRLLPENIHLELESMPATYMVNADPTRLQQVFMNLAVNARDAMPSGGTLRFKMQKLELKPGQETPFPYLPAGDWVVISVEDTGTGIAPDVIPHIFEPFYTTKTVGEGTGLGLAQVYGIIKQHNGFIDVTSQGGHGAVFTIYLPALDAVLNDETQQQLPAFFDGGGEVVLLVEDDDATRNALQELLTAQNYKVIPASNGVEALHTFAQNGQKIALVISDVVMPEMGGVTLYNSLVKIQPDLKMLFITGHPMEMEEQSTFDKGYVRWLQKPFSVHEFSQLVQSILGRA